MRELLARIDGLQGQVNALTKIVKASVDYIQQVPENSVLNDLLIAIEDGLTEISKYR